jgi:predicted metal-dependent hydrolase
MTRSEARTVLQGGRRKAYRPMPEADRLAALESGLEAYARGEYFEAHEILEPAWMGAEDIAERELLQGLIKLAAAYVHATRGNPAGVEKNLRGALARIEAGRAAGPRLRVDADALARVVRARLDAVSGPTALVDPAPVVPRR